MNIEEIKSYEKFPNDYRHCIFSHHAYHFGGESTPSKHEENVLIATKNLKENFKIMYDVGWRVKHVQIENGFQSMLYINDERKQLVLAFKGVQIEIRNLFLKG
jgi:hypothetical protein